jgi:hypothetical protein
MSKFANEMDMIRAFYGDRTAKRSGVDLIEHIEQGLRVINAREAGQWAWRAFCIHPILQRDEDLIAARYRIDELHPMTVCLAMEYRAVANAGLRGAFESTSYLPKLSCLPAVNEMLVADKVQNRKDFERYNFSHPEADKLRDYFHRWMIALNISDVEYQRLCAVMEEV